VSLPARVSATPSPDPASFREALGRFATGVALVTAAPAGEPAALIVNSFTSVSLDPPLIAFCPSRSSLTWGRMRRARQFAVNVLGQQHARFARRAARPGADRFAGVEWELGSRGEPLLSDALATLQCETVAEHPAGDHWVVVARVGELCISPGTDPLIFFDGEFRAIHKPPVREELPS
jgi:3-hydroxy-9,10-secoandrosta-1,3,5(10)-triene-9,17-dione monooxygenase reductase component